MSFKDPTGLEYLGNETLYKEMSYQQALQYKQGLKELKKENQENPLLNIYREVKDLVTSISLGKLFGKARDYVDKASNLIDGGSYVYEKSGAPPIIDKLPTIENALDRVDTLLDKVQEQYLKEDKNIKDAKFNIGKDMYIDDETGQNITKYYMETGSGDNYKRVTLNTSYTENGGKVIGDEKLQKIAPEKKNE